MTGDDPHRDPTPGTVSPYAPPCAEPLPESAMEDFHPDGRQVRPRVRFWARSLDEGAFAVIVGWVAIWLVPDLYEMPDLWFGLLLGVVYLPFEALFFAGFGTTPGKALLNLRIRHQNGSRLSFGEALRRCARVWLAGEALGLHLLTYITMIVARRRLQRDGITSWDRTMRLTAVHREVDGWRWMLVVVLHLVLIALILLPYMAARGAIDLGEWFE